MTAVWSKDQYTKKWLSVMKASSMGAQQNHHHRKQNRNKNKHECIAVVFVKSATYFHSLNSSFLSVLVRPVLKIIVNKFSREHVCICCKLRCIRWQNDSTKKRRKIDALTFNGHAFFYSFSICLWFVVVNRSGLAHHPISKRIANAHGYTHELGCRTDTLEERIRFGFDLAPPMRYFMA